MVRIYLGGHLNFYAPGHSTWVEVKLDARDANTAFREDADAAFGSIRLSALLQQIGVPPAEVYLAAINGEAVEMAEAVVQAGDVVRLFPPVSGG